MFAGGTLTTNCPGFPNTGNPLVPGLPNTGIAPKNKNTHWNIAVGVLFSFVIFCLAWKMYKKILKR